MSKFILLLVSLIFSTATLSAGKYSFVSHAPDSDSWWNTIKNSLRHAEADFDIKVDYKNPSNGDLSEMARLIEQSAARNYDGVVTTIADYNVLKSSINKVKRKNIPFVTVNSGTLDQSEDLGAVMHIGQPEYFAGLKTGERVKKNSGAKSFLCVNHFATNPVSFERCKGIAEGLGISSKDSILDTGTDPTTIESKVSAYMRKNPKTEAVITLGPLGAAPTYNALKKMGKLGKVYFATFEVSEQIVKGIKEGYIAFGIDQQPYLQGYVSVAILEIMRKNNITSAKEAWTILSANAKFQKRLKTYGLKPQFDGTRHINSGPGFIDKKTLPLVEEFAGKYR